MRLRTKAFLAFGLVLAGTVVLGARLVIGEREAAFERELAATRSAASASLEARAQLLARTMGTFVAGALPGHELDLIARELTTLAESDPDIEYGILMDTSRRAMVHPDESMVTQTLSDEQARWAAGVQSTAGRVFRGGVLEVATPIVQAAIDPSTGEDVQRRAATLRFGLSTAGTDRQVEIAESAHREQLARLWRIASLFTAGALGLALLLTFVMGGRLVRPLERLTQEAETIAKGDLDHPITGGDSRDELGRLASSFEQMRRGVRDLLAQTAEKARMEAELQTAREVQQALLPTAPPDSDRFDLAAFYEPATETGGDWYAWFPGEGHRVYVIVGDVTGHGAASALVAAAARSAASVLAASARDLSPTRLLSMLNREILTIADRRHRMTCVVAQLDLESGRLVVAGAAHAKPILMRADGELNVLQVAGPILGEGAAARFHEREAVLAPGDTLLLYTDGLIENRDGRDREFGRRRLVAALRNAVAHPSAQQVVDSVSRAALDFYDGRALGDDVTIAVVRARILEREC